jgi:hypothetical protein
VVPDAVASVKALARVPELNRAAIRECFEQRFSASRMAQDYVAIYERLIGDEPGAFKLSEGMSVGRGNDPAVLHSDEVGAA